MNLRYASLRSTVIALLLSSPTWAQQGSTPTNGQNPVGPANAHTISTTTPPTPQNGNHTLGPVYNNAACGLNYVSISAKVSQRVSSFSTPGAPQPQTASIVLPPSPCGSSSLPILKAFLWAEGSGNGAPITVNITNPYLTPYSFPMTLVGSDQDKCWGYTGSYTYRADVTACVTGAGNYVISNLPVDPPPLQYTNDIDGYTLMIIYQDPAATYTGEIYIWDGATTINGGQTTQIVNNFNACAFGANARAFCAVGDLQGMGCQFTFDGGAPFTVTEDWWNYVDMPANINFGQNTYSFDLNSSGDCYNLAMMGIYYQTPCINCVPASSFTVSSTSTPSQCTANTGTATVTPSGTGPYTYSWQPTGQNTQTATNLAPGSYTVTVTDAGGCQAIDTIIVGGQGNLSFTPTITNVTCFGGNNGSISVVPNGGGGPYTYGWAPNVSSASAATNLTAGSYTCTVTDAFGCTSTQTLTVTEPAQVALTVTASGGTAICTGSSANLTSNGSGGNGGPYTYTWLTTPPQTGSSITVSPTTTTNYTVVITDACGSPADSDIVTITVNQLPVVSVSGTPVSGCVPLCVTLTNTSTPITMSATWDFGDNTTSTALVPPAHCYPIAGSYNITLHVTDLNGCVSQQVFPNFINAYPIPNASFSISTPMPVTVLDPYIALDDGSTGGDTCSWDFGDGNTMVVPNCGDIVHAYGDTGSYTLRQVVTNQYGCSDTAYSDVFIAPFTTLYVPNTFTPNGDGNNDIFYAYGDFIGSFEMWVFDRWGNLIFKSNDQHIGWDGHANGGKDLAQIDTYVYKIIATEEYTGKRLKFIGHINLIR